MSTTDTITIEGFTAWLAAFRDRVTEQRS